MKQKSDHVLSRKLGFSAEEVYKRRQDVGPLPPMWDAMSRLIEDHGTDYLVTPDGRRDFLRAAQALVDRHGPSVWPPPSTDRSKWLMDATACDNLSRNLYPRDLYYAVEADRER